MRRIPHARFYRLVHRTAAGACWLGVMMITGCGDGKLPLYPVTGKVLVDGKPAAAAMVIFCPIEGSDELLRERPFGITASDGTFQLTTYVKDDGGPAGEYKILAQWLSEPSPNADRDRGGGQFDRLNGRYFKLENTPLTATLIEGTNELTPFELRSR
jgi:hypothetical protein